MVNEKPVFKTKILLMSIIAIIRAQIKVSGHYSLDKNEFVNVFSKFYMHIANGEREICVQNKNIIDVHISHNTQLFI